MLGAGTGDAASQCSGASGRGRAASAGSEQADGERVREVSVRWSAFRQSFGLRSPSDTLRSASNSSTGRADRHARAFEELPTVVGARPRRRNRVLRVHASRRAFRSSTGMLRVRVHAASGDRERMRREPNSGFLKRSEHRSAAAIQRRVAAGAFTGAG
jgi:hypothetical protein